jgi:hypothetical protein
MAHGRPHGPASHPAAAPNAYDMQNRELRRNTKRREAHANYASGYEGALAAAQDGSYIASSQDVYNRYVRPEMKAEFDKAKSAGQGMYENSMAAAKFRNAQRGSSLGIGGSASAALDSAFEDDALRRLGAKRQEAEAQFNQWSQDPARMSKLREYESAVYEGMSRRSRNARSANSTVGAVGTAVGGLLSTNPITAPIGAAITIGEQLRTLGTSLGIDAKEKAERRRAGRRMGSAATQNNFSFNPSGGAGAAGGGYELNTAGSSQNALQSAFYKPEQDWDNNAAGQWNQNAQFQGYR